MILGDDHALLEGPYVVSIITAAAVNASRVPPTLKDGIVPAMRQQILKVLSIGVEHHHDAIVLGAWGCGAFGNDGAEIAGHFREAIQVHFRGAYRRVIFAIVDWSPERKFIGPFERAFQLEAP